MYYLSISAGETLRGQSLCYYGGIDYGYGYIKCWFSEGRRLHIYIGI
jgi:hypothetical protein